MKKLIFILIMLMVILTGCDNNDGPFTERMENGKRVLYSGDKPAKGGVSLTIINKAGLEVTVSEIEYDKGRPTGNFTLYKANGTVMLEAKGKWENGLYNGNIKETYNDSEYVEAKGKFELPENFVLNYTGQRRGYNSGYLFFFFYYNVAQDTLVDGKATGYKGKKVILEIEKKDYKTIKNIIYDEDGTVRN